MHSQALWERKKNNSEMRKMTLGGRGQGVTHLKDFGKEDIAGKEKICEEQYIQWSGDKAVEWG